MPATIERLRDAAEQPGGVEALIEGYRRFRRGPYQAQRERYDALACKGQKPEVMVIACCDSRVDPSIVFDAAPGQMFVLRHIAALVPPCERDGKHHSASAAVEYAVTQLEVSNIVVFGHGRCGGIQASLSGCFREAPECEGGFVHHWMEIIEPARRRIAEAAAASPDIDAQRALELAAIRVSLDNLRSFAFVQAREQAGGLKLHGAFFDISDGILRLLDPASGRFEAVDFLKDDALAEAA
jgi:carbonic anhydrase